MAKPGDTQTQVICPVCEEEVIIPIEVEIQDAEFAYLGMAVMVCTPDVSQLTAHMFSHQIDEGLPSD